MELLYQPAQDCFCERLVSHTFHVTLYDLSNAPILRDVESESSNGGSYFVYKTLDFDLENPVYKVKVWDKSGKRQ